MPYTPAGNLPQGFEIPQNNSGHGNVLKVGRGVSVYVDFQPPNLWRKHQHQTAQIVLALDPVASHMRWWHGHTPVEETYTMPHVWCLPHDTPHTVAWSGTAALVVLYVEREFLLEECGAELTEGVVFPLAPLAQQDYLIARFVRKFHDHCHRRRLLSEPMFFAGAILLSAAVLHLCLGRTAAKRRSACGLSEKRLEVFAHFLQNHLREPLTPAVLAAAVGMSEDHFGRMLRLATGLPPMQYVWRCRLHHARLLLETGEWKVAQVAAETGFCDQSHLDRRFRKEFGCTPGFVIPQAQGRRFQRVRRACR